MNASPSPASVAHSDDTETAGIHLGFLRGVADAGEDGDQGVTSVESYHRALFLQRHGVDLERCRQDRLVRETAIARLETRLAEARARLEGIEPSLAILEDGQPDQRPRPPWNPWSVSMFVASALGIVGLLAFGIFNISFNLLESGIVTFTSNPIRTYLWAALLPIGALAVKIGWDLLPPRSGRRDLYVASCLVLGLLGVLTWVGTYAVVYPSLSQSAADQIQALNVLDGPGTDTRLFPARTLDAVLVASQAIAEIFLSAVLGIHLTQLHARHRPTRLADNPVFVRLDHERRTLETELAAERLALAQALGEETRLDHQLLNLVATARNRFQREVVRRRQLSHRKHRLIEETLADLGARLEALDRAAEASSDIPEPTSVPFPTATVAATHP